MTFAMGGAPIPGSYRIPVELFQILKDDAVESAALNMQYAGSRQATLIMFTTLYIIFQVLIYLIIGSFFLLTVLVELPILLCF